MVLLPADGCNIIWPMICTNIIEAQDQTLRRDRAQDCSLGGRLSIAADLPIAGTVLMR